MCFYRKALFYWVCCVCFLNNSIFKYNLKKNIFLCKYEYSINVARRFMKYLVYIIYFNLLDVIIKYASSISIKRFFVIEIELIKNYLEKLIALRELFLYSIYYLNFAVLHNTAVCIKYKIYITLVLC